MLVLRGFPALSPSRLARLQADVRAQLPELTAVEVDWLHLIDLSEQLNAEQEQLLRRLLTYGAPFVRRAESGDKVAAIKGTATRRLRLITPRIGTQSPWSSKATEIVRNCGLRAVRRIERGRACYLSSEQPLMGEQLAHVDPLLHDPMTESLLESLESSAALFQQQPPRPLTRVELLRGGVDALERANSELGLALSREEITYLAQAYQELKRDPTDAELMMFAQANSEHCRHKIFNADWEIDGRAQEKSLFAMIRNTYLHAPEGILSAYKDNAAVISGARANRFFANADGNYDAHPEEVAVLMKVETHNHPTAISPFPGAATGAGGEIRDEGATGRGGKPKAGLTGFSVSNLRIPAFEQPWEQDHGRPARIASALTIMLEGPIGAAAFNNEFGRPTLCGYLRTFEERVPGADGVWLRGYHKPIMVAGGFGNIRTQHVKKRPLVPGTRLIVLGGPSMLIGLGGGAASSMSSGSSSEQLDFGSVQRGNPEMQRRAQEVIDRCWALDDRNPILSIHDVGAGGLSNALPEIVNDAGRGGRFELRAIPSAEPGLSPMEIWCNEAQERYVLAVAQADLERFAAICRRERCPFAVIGQVTSDQRVKVQDRELNESPVDMALPLLLGQPPRMLRRGQHIAVDHHPFTTAGRRLYDAALRVLRLPGVASKAFLITIGDRTVGGLSCRDQMVGPWQVPVADVAVTATSFDVHSGEAMALGERAPIALLDGPASARMAIGEAITNIAAAAIDHLGALRLSANWMASAGHPGEEATLFDTVEAVGEQLCPALGLAIPVGKDSLSMRTMWEEGGEKRSVTAPLSLVVTAFAPVTEIRRTLTPQLRTDLGPSELLLIDLGRGANRLGGSALAQVYQQIGDQPPDLSEPELLRRLFDAIQALNRRGLLLAYHDRSDGGLFVTLCEMAFAGHCGLEIWADALGDDLLAGLFSEELGVVIQIASRNRREVLEQLERAGLAELCRFIASPTRDDWIEVVHRGRLQFSESRVKLQRLWAETSYRMQALRDDPICAREEFDTLLDAADPGLNPRLSFDPKENPAAPFLLRGSRPRIAILREQGVNGQVEMAAAFDRAGFTAVDLHMSDLASGARDLEEFVGLAACGGFSFGDVLGAGQGWAKSILFNPKLREMLQTFFHREDRFALGVCNGCQMLAGLQELIPGADCWPLLLPNRSEQFEARLSLVEITPTSSLFLQGMEGSRLPIAVAHGEGRVQLRAGTQIDQIESISCLRYVDHRGHAAEHYPANPNGSQAGITGLCNLDGRITIMMPHPERVFRTAQLSWHPDEWPEESPWMRMFRNARAWVA